MEDNNIYAGLAFAPEKLDAPGLRNASLEMLRPFVPSLFKKKEPRRSRRIVRANTDMSNLVPSGVDGNLSNLVATIENGYNKLIYHNFAHAVDVTHAMFFFITEHDFELKEQEKFYLLLGCLCHDLGHFGVGNGVLNKELKGCAFSRQHDRCLHEEGCKRSVMEFYHLENSIQIIDTHPFFQHDNLVPDVVRNLKSWMGDLILATDLANQKFFLDVVEGSKPFSPLEGADPNAKRPTPLMLLLVKLADLGNVFRTFESAKAWTEMIMIEMECADKAKQYILTSKTPIESLTQETIMDLCMNPKIEVEYDLKPEIVEKRMQSFIENLVMPCVLPLRDLHPELFFSLCKGIKDSLDGSTYTDTSFVTEICPKLKDEK